MNAPKFSIRVEEPNPFPEGTIIWQAAQIVIALKDCAVPAIVDALEAFTRDATPKGEGDSPRWLIHFAGLESVQSGKARRPWIKILHDGEPVRSRAEFRQLLRGL